jgi:hypothetical protein
MRTPLIMTSVFLLAAFLTPSLGDHRPLFAGVLVAEFAMGWACGYVCGKRSKNVVYQVLQYRDGFRIRRKRAWGWQQMTGTPLKNQDEAIAQVEEWRNPKPPVIVWEES